MNNMKVLILFFTLINALTINLGTTYKTKEEIFLNTVNEAYDTYTLNNITTVVGQMYVVVGKVDNDISFSVYFNNEKSGEYNVNIKKNEKTYSLSKYDDYQVYYDIKADSKNTYMIELMSKDSSIPYYVYQVNQNDNNKIKGEGTNNFPYHTKLRNRISSFGIMLVVGIPIILLEGLVIVLILTKKQKHHKHNNIGHTTYNNIAYTIEDNNDEE